MKMITKNGWRILKIRACDMAAALNHFFPIHPFPTPIKMYGFMFLGGRERVHWEQMV